MKDWLIAAALFFMLLTLLVATGGLEGWIGRIGNMINDNSVPAEDAASFLLAIMAIIVTGLVVTWLGKEE